MTIFASGALLCASIVVVTMALRPVATVLRSGIVLAGVFGQLATSLAWDEIVRIESADDVVSITTRQKRLYQLQVDLRTAAFLSRMMERRISLRGTRP